MDLAHQYHQQQYYNPYGAGAVAPLPPGWIEYRTPTGQPYWYNSITTQSSWTYPVTVNIPPPLQQQQQAVVAAPKKKKQIKKKIPGTHWLFVLTHDGYEFYYDRETKTSVWEMPEELKEPMKELKKLEEEEKQKKKLEKEAQKRKLEEAAKKAEEEEENRKRKALEAEQAEQEAKRVKLEEEIVEAQDGEEEGEQEEELDTTEMTEEDIMWQLQQMAEQEIEQEGEGEEEEQDIQQVEEREEQPVKQAQEEQTKEPQLTEEECIEKFNELLQERNISPFAIYSTEYPQLMTDPRFSLVPPNKQKALFNKYCNALGEKLKNEKAHTKKPEDEFKELLQDKVTTKMYWDDFRRKFKDDSRFKALKVTKEKEALFKEHIKHGLNKKKRSPVDEYIDLLKQTKEIKQGIRWRDAKKILEKDDRYFLVEDKEKREDLFRDYLDGLI